MEVYLQRQLMNTVDGFYELPLCLFDKYLIKLRKIGKNKIKNKIQT